MQTLQHKKPHCSHCQPSPPKKKSTKRLSINISNCLSQLQLLRDIIKTQNWIQSSKGKIIWYGFRLHDLQLTLPPNSILNRIPGMQTICHKRQLGQLLKLISRYYPQQFNIFPRTYILPQDIQSLQHRMENSKNYFILKPTQGAQGEGITIIKTPRELQNWRTRPLQDLVVQQYIHPPLLLYRKKFDLRLYVVVTSVEPLVAFLNHQGLARFCTVDYQAPNKQNITNVYMHLTNYSMNKISTGFVHTDEVSEPNNGSKQTLTSLFKALELEGVDTVYIRQQINELVGKTLVACKANLKNLFDAQLKQQKLAKLKCFQILGIDVLIDRNLKPWLLEINGNPSFRIDFQQEIRPGVNQSYPSRLDHYVKSQVVTHAIQLMQITKREQIQIQEFKSYWKILPSRAAYISCGDLFDEFLSLFEKLAEIRNPSVISSSKFRKLRPVLNRVLGVNILGADFDILYSTIVRRYQVSQIGYFTFIAALESIIIKYGGDSQLSIAMSHVLRSINREF